MLFLFGVRENFDSTCNRLVLCIDLQPNGFKMALDPQEMQAAIVANLPAKTGKTLEQWLEFAKQHQDQKPKELIAWLKTEHGLGHVQAQTVVRHLAEVPYLVADWNPKELFGPVLSPVYELAKAQLLSYPGVTERPCKSYVPFYAKKQFAVLLPFQKAVWLAIVLPEAYAKEAIAAGWQPCPRTANFKSIGPRFNFCQVVQEDWSPGANSLLSVAHQVNQS